jgi:hypothetical protein
MLFSSSRKSVMMMSACDMAPHDADPKPGSGPLTGLLDGVRRGDRAALEQLMAVVYPELRRIAARYMRLERPGHTLQNHRARPRGVRPSVRLRPGLAESRALFRGRVA